MSRNLSQLLDFAAPGAVIAGVDEAGRGPLAGPVVAAAVILDAGKPVAGLRDSKALSECRRTRLAREIRRNAVAFSLGISGPGEVDELNILQASLLAMERAVLGLTVHPDVVRVDGNQIPAFKDHPGRYLTEAVVRGDQSVPCISAASILAKVCRDRLMRRWHRRFPGYGFDRHKGYPTRAHIEALHKLGPCAIHRTSFAPLRRESVVPAT
ncbi:ribonuclease HII [Candidatus Rariloculus sp.]|uniref:ribonuclease HII n=1 Tax=Candidatus Rariloculus sp. TaxID=3101265 RepID=UPI003D10BD89